MDWTFGDFIWSMILFFFWFMFIWMFIAVFADIFRRENLSGWAKAGWIVLIIVLPFIGILIYVIARPKNTEQDRRMVAEARRMSGYSAADELAKLGQLHDAGKLTDEEFATLKQRAMA
jgi:hypothetical protein